MYTPNNLFNTFLYNMPPFNKFLFNKYLFKFLKLFNNLFLNNHKD